MALHQASPLQVQADLLAKFFSGLAHPIRYRLVAALTEKERNVNELVQLLGCSQSQVSNHLACLKWCGYVTGRQEGKHIYYQVTDGRILEDSPAGPIHCRGQRRAHQVLHQDVKGVLHLREKLSSLGSVLSSFLAAIC